MDNGQWTSLPEIVIEGGLVRIYRMTQSRFNGETRPITPHSFSDGPENASCVPLTYESTRMKCPAFRKMFKRKGRSWPAYLFRLAILAVLIFVTFSVLITVAYRFVNPPITPLMLKMALRETPEGEKYGIYKTWVDLEEISPNMVLAVVASEDNRFLEHHGFDLKALREAMEHNEKGGRKRGGSTISMQTAKNVFLWDGRTYVRKAFEAWFTVLIELIWGKERIMEVYLNVIEVGKGHYGVESAARKYYGTESARLSRRQAAMIAAILPNPRQRDPRRPSSYMYQRQRWILWNMNNIEMVKFD